MRMQLKSGFTLIELLVVMAIIGTLLTIATPRYFRSVEKSKEAVLRQNLESTREALDKYFGDNGRYPDRLADLVEKKYLRSLPYDPVAESNDAWLIMPPDSSEKGGVYDIKSGATGNALDGSGYRDW